MVGTLKEFDGTKVSSKEKRRKKTLFRRMLRRAKYHGVKLIHDETGKVTKAIIAPGNWKPLIFDVFIENGLLMVKNDIWGVNEANLLIPNIND